MKTLRNLVLFISILFISAVFSQERKTAKFGSPTEKEFAMDSYPPEPDAPGVILFESGNYYAIPIIKKTSVRLVKEVHRKIKVFDAKKFDYATVEIPYLSGYYYSDEINDYEAVTHNGPVKSFVPNGSFYKTYKQGVGNVLRFTFPNVQDGSILEYTYKIVSPFFYDLEGWEFQHELPTLYSEFQTDLPWHFRYNKIRYGDKKLDIEKSRVNKNGFRLPSNSGFADTELSVYAMNDVPSFTEEKYMLSKKNYISRIVYEPLAFKAFYGYDQVFTRKWEDVDYRFKIDEDFGEQLTKKNYFKRQLPDSILDISNDLERAKAVFAFIRDRYTWNERYFNYEENVKESYDEKLGSVSTINISLINALAAAKLEAKPMLLSTRQNGLPTELYPVISNFNYIIVFLTIGNKNYLLDATDKQTPFEILPFRTLNSQGRVMDFKKGSYWMPIEPFKKNIDYVNSQITVEANGNFKGTVNHASYGYLALEKRNSIEEEGLQEYIKTQEKEKAGIEIENFQVEDINFNEKPLKEDYTISIEPETVGDKVILYPFFNKLYISENPFKMKERSYPMDFGFPFTNTYLISIDLGDVYKIEQLPKSRSIKLPGEDGECSVTYVAEGSKINIRFNMKLNAYRFPTDAYPSLKEFFGNMITILKNEPIVLKK